MSVSLTPVLIVAIVFSFVSFSTYMSYKTKQLKLLGEKQSSDMEAENAELRSTVDNLEKRIQTLESIVTSKDFRLAEEIETLT